MRTSRLYRYRSRLSVLQAGGELASPLSVRRMGSLRIRHLLPAACLVAAGALWPTWAQASPTQESILQDDPLVVFHSSPGALNATFAQLHSLGVDRVRVTVFWNLVAPRPHARRQPRWGSHGGADPGKYPKHSWDRYDRIVRLATKNRLKLLF